MDVYTDMNKDRPSKIQHIITRALDFKETKGSKSRHARIIDNQ